MRPTPKQLEDAKDNAAHAWKRWQEGKCSHTSCEAQAIALFWRPPNYHILTTSRCWLWSRCSNCKIEEDGLENIEIILLNEQELFYLRII